MIGSFLSLDSPPAPGELRSLLAMISPAAVEPSLLVCSISMPARAHEIFPAAKISIRRFSDLGAQGSSLICTHLPISHYPFN